MIFFEDTPFPGYKRDPFLEVPYIYVFFFQRFFFFFRLLVKTFGGMVLWPFFFFFFCRNFVNNFPYLIPPTTSGPKAYLNPSGFVGLATNPVQNLSRPSLAQLGPVGLATNPLQNLSRP